MPVQYEQWLDAQTLSESASKNYANFKDVIFPLDKTKKRDILDKLWKLVNLVSLKS